MSQPPVPVRWHDHVDSTQDVARALHQGGEVGPLAVATDDQRRGRGRRGRTWSTPRGAGLALTLLRGADLPPAHRGWIPLVVGLGALHVLHDLAPDAGIGLKWPNDLLAAEDAKLAGILVDVDPAVPGGPGEALVIGIGVNLRPVGALPGDARTIDLASCGAGHIDPRGLAERLAAGIEGELRLLVRHAGDAVGSGHAARYRENCVTTGRRVRTDLLGLQDPQPGSVEGIDDQGRLLVRREDGGLHPVHAADVTHVRDAAAPAPPSTAEEDT
ncbi:MAG: biotin--[acetyl-CoA-carboxylase] ligase [Brachybacterium sp.]|nr:biotin--[acetyl-CoA-carboxylase] ligase [Brachybacterium sp.]